MTTEATSKERYLQDATPLRLGNLASSIKRLGRFVLKEEFEKTTHQLFQECQSFSAWAFPEVDFDTQLALADLQAQMANWVRDFDDRKNEKTWCVEVNIACEKWSQRLLELSGLLQPGVQRQQQP